MSHFSKIQVEILDQDCLIAALKLFGYSPEIHTEAQALYGYQGDKREDAAHIIVRRKQIHPYSNDLGFAHDGKCYSMIISDYDAKYGNAQVNQSATARAGLGPNFQSRLMNEYNRLVVIKQAESLGQPYTITQLENGGYQIKVQAKPKTAVKRVGANTAKVQSKIKSRY